MIKIKISKSEKKCEVGNTARSTWKYSRPQGLRCRTLPGRPGSISDRSLAAFQASVPDLSGGQDRAVWYSTQIPKNADPAEIYSCTSLQNEWVVVRMC